MEEYEEVFEYDNSEPEDAWWNEQYEDYEYLEDDESSGQEDRPESYPALDELLEILSGTQNYGNMGDYYNTELGCYVFPGYEVYEYFIDVDAVGHEWTETSDGHYIPLLYLEAYEGYRSGNGEEEEQEEAADVLPSVTETETLETLESVRGLLSVIKENELTYYDAVLDHQTEMLENQERSLAFAEGMLYGTIVNSVLLAVLAGTFISHVFFGRLKGG